MIHVLSMHYHPFGGPEVWSGASVGQIWEKNAGQFNKLDKVPSKAWGLIERAVRGKKK